MRLPVVHQISTKDGTTNKNARLFNMLKESTKAGDLAVIRPSLVESTTYSGVGNGLIVFNRNLLVIVDDKVQFDEFAWMDLDAVDWDAITVFSEGDWVWYNGVLWVSVDSNSNQAPFLNSTHWRTIYEIPDWDAGEAYAIGDSVVYGDTLYYSMGPSNTGNNPASTPMWSTTEPGSSRWRGSYYVSAILIQSSFTTASKASAGYAAWQELEPNYDCAHKNGTRWREFSRVADTQTPSFPYYELYVNAFDTLPPAYDCTSSSFTQEQSFGRVLQTV